MCVCMSVYYIIRIELQNKKYSIYQHNISYKVNNFKYNINININK